MYMLKEFEVSRPEEGSELWRIRAVVNDGAKSKHVDFSVRDPYLVFEMMSRQLALRGPDYLGEAFIEASKDVDAYILGGELPF